MPQYIHRDRMTLHFGKRPSRLNRPLLIFWTLCMVGVGVALAHLDDLRAQVWNSVMGPPAPTRTASQSAVGAYDAYLDGDLATAETGFADAVRTDPTNLDFLYEYGRMLLFNSRDDRALEIADQAIAAAPQDPRGYALKVFALFGLDRTEEAVPVGLQALEIDPNFAPTYAALAWAYTDIGRWSQGLEMAGRAVQLDPNNVEARRALAYSLAYTGQPALAAHQMEAAIAIHPNLDVLYFELAGYYRGSQNEPAALAAYERILEHDPTNVKAMVRSCETYWGLRQDVLAQSYCEDALDLDPNSADAWAQIGQIYFTRRNYESAIDALQRCVDLGSQAIQCYYIRGLAHYYLAQCDQAVPILQEALNLADDEQIRSIVLEGLRLCAVTDDDYDESIIPTPAPTPTYVPTPIGVF